MQAKHEFESSPVGHIVGSMMQLKHAVGSDGQLPVALPEPPPVQSDGQLVLVSPLSHVPFPHTAPVLLPVLLPVFEPVLLPVPQSAGQLLTSLAAQTPSPQRVLVEPPASAPLEAPPQLQATANDSAPATAHTIPDEALIIMSGIVLMQIRGSTRKYELRSDQPLSDPYTDCASLRESAALKPACSGRSRSGSSSRIAAAWRRASSKSSKC
jgi:hypothetical protein